MLAFFRNDMGFGGNNGFTDFKDILGFDLQANGTRVFLVVTSAVALAASYLLCRFIVTSRAGKVIRAIRDAEGRTRFLGYPVESYKLWVFVTSAALAGVAGALYVPQVGIINPSEFAPINSIEVVIWVAVGGRGTLFGATAGRRPGELCQDVLHRRDSGSVALRARCAVHSRHAVPAERRCRLSPGRQACRVGAAKRASAIRTPSMSRLNQMLYLERLTVTFDGFKALDGLTLYVEPGELRCVIGPNGAGKTTMMDVVTGKTRPDSGTAWFGPQLNLLTMSEPEIARAGIGRKFQKPTVFEPLTVFENLELALAGGQGFSTVASWRACHSTERDRIAHVLDTIGLTGRAGHLAGTLAHGQKQWLEIGMLLMQEPELLLVDEPVAGMTPHETERTAELLVSLAGTHSVVVVEHDMEFVRSIARNVTVLHEGRVLAEGTMDTVQNDQRVVTSTSEPEVLTVESLSQAYGGSRTLWDVDLNVAAGSRTCLMGRNGMGKSTLLKCIMGLEPALGGSLVFDGTSCRGFRPKRGRALASGTYRRAARSFRS